MLAFLATRGAQCTRELDLLAARARAPSPACRSPPSSIRGDRGDLRALVRRHGWRFPVGLGPRRRRGQPLRRRRLPAAHLRAARRRACRPRASASSTTPSSTARLVALEREARGMDRRRDRRGPGARGGLGRPRAGAEFPELRLVLGASRRRPGARTPSALRERLALLADRFRGAQAVTLRREPVPHAYRVFFRHVGLDPDAQRTPVEAAALERLRAAAASPRAGCWTTRCSSRWSRPACRCGRSTTRALDGPLGLRGARAGRAAGRGRVRRRPRARARSWSPTPRGPVAVLFGDVAPEPRAPARDSARCGCSPSRSPGVPALHVEEALFGCVEALVGRRVAPE